MKSYQELSIYQTAFSLAKEVHLLSFKMPKHEIYKLGSQVRRPAQSIRTKGYGRRKYKADFIKFLVYADGSLLETVSHLNMIAELYLIARYLNHHRKIQPVR